MAATPRPVAAPQGLAEAVCLVLVVQGADHGWSIGTLLGPDGELGRIWSLSRPLTYRAIDGLVTRKLVTRAGAEGARGRERSMLTVTGAGKRAAVAWLDAPAAHLRDLRTELLLKLELRRRAGLDPEPLLTAQEELLGPTIDALSTAAVGDDLVALWRQENARAVRRFLRQARELPLGPARERPRRNVRLSARNQLRATVDTVGQGDVMSTIKAVLPDGQRLTAAITTDAAVDLDIASGDEVLMIIKSTEIIVAKPD